MGESRTLQEIGEDKNVHKKAAVYICNTYTYRLHVNPVAIQTATVEVLAPIAWYENIVFQVIV